MTKEREVSLWDMFWAVCMQWRKIIVVGVIFAVLLGGMSVLNSVRQIRINQAIDEQNLEDFALNENQMANVNLYLKYKELYEQENMYAQKSPIMKLDGTKALCGKVFAYVDNNYTVEYPIVEKKDCAGALVEFYKSLFDTDQISEDICKIYGGDIKDVSYYGELVAATNMGDGVLSVSVYAQNEEQCKAMLQLVKDSVEAKRKQAADMFEEHDIVWMSEECVQEYSEYIFELQERNLKGLYTYGKSVQDNYAVLSEEELLYIEKIEEMASGEYGTGNVLSEELVKISVDIKYVLVGFVGGVFVMFFAMVVLYIVNSKVRIEDELEKYLEEKVLGIVLLGNQSKKKWFSFIDKFFLRMRHYNKHYFKKDASIQMIAANIKIYAKQNNADKVYVSGAACSEIDKEVIGQIGEELAGSDVQLVFGKPVLYDAEALTQMVEVGTVVFVEQAQNSTYRELEKVKEICKSQDVNLLGYLVIQA